MKAQTKIIKALKREIPDRVPYFEIDISPQVVKEILGKETFTEKEISRCMHRDHIVWWGYPDPFVQRQSQKLRLLRDFLSACGHAQAGIPHNDTGFTEYLYEWQGYL